MLKRYKLFAAFLLVCMLSLTNLPFTGNILNAQAATISISKTSYTLEAGHYKTLYVYGTSSKVIWSSSNTSVATVTSTGKVTAKSVGIATIYASVAGKKLGCKITVIKISSQSMVLFKGDTTTLKVLGTTAAVTWTSGNSAVVSVSTSGKVTAKAVGTATIYASVSGKKLDCVITVKAPVTLSSQSLALTTGSSQSLKVSGTTASITWLSSNPSVAEVSSAGLVTAKAPGTTAVTATVYSKVLTCTVIVTDPTGGQTTDTQNPPDYNSPADDSQTASGSNTAPGPNTTLSTRVIGYYAAWAAYSGYTPDKIDALRLTHINYAFANIGSDLKISLGFPDVDEANISKLNALKKINTNLKTIISVGGWSWSGRFSDAALTQESRDAFADSCVAFIVKYGFDGVDIDWEYPVNGGLATNIHRPEDKNNFTLLMQTLRQKLDAQGVVDGKNYILSYAGASGDWYLNNIQPAAINNYVDYVNVMTYDLHGNWEPDTNFNAPLYLSGSGQPSDDISVDSAIRAWIAAGVSKDKLVMGVPFYGYIYKSVANINNGLYQTYSGGASISYANVAANYLNAAGYTRYFQSNSLVPWLFNGSTFITYEDAQSMAEKAKYIKSNGLGGAMIWELSQDPGHVLLNSLYNGLSG